VETRNRVHNSQVLSSQFLEIHFNIVLPSTHWSSKWSLSFRFSTQKKSLWIYFQPHKCHTSPSRFPLFLYELNFDFLGVVPKNMKFVTHFISRNNEWRLKGVRTQPSLPVQRRNHVSPSITVLSLKFSNDKYICPVIKVFTPTDAHVFNTLQRTWGVI